MLTQGLTGGCSESCAGGVDRIAIANKADIASITVDANGNVTAVVMQSGKLFFEFVAESDTAIFTEEVKTVKGCAVSSTPKLVFDSNCFSGDTKKTIKEIADASCCGLVFIHKEATGLSYIWGLDTTDIANSRIKGYLETSSRTTGGTFEDINKAALTFTAKQRLQAAIFTGGFAAIPLS